MMSSVWCGEGGRQQYLSWASMEGLGFSLSEIGEGRPLQRENV